MKGLFFRLSPRAGGRAGTANTEFETISGMSLRYFGAGEYPYKSVLSEETCESAPYVLKNLGYATHAIHNNEANFYSRRSVFLTSWFDTFTSEEYMPDISDVTATGWSKRPYSDKRDHKNARCDRRTGLYLYDFGTGPR